MIELVGFYFVLILVLFVVFLFVMKLKRTHRDMYFVKYRLSIFKRRLRTMSFVDSNQINNFQQRIKNMMKSLSQKNERLEKLEDLLYGKADHRIGIQLPPLDLTKSGIFSVR